MHIDVYRLYIAIIKRFHLWFMHDTCQRYGHDRLKAHMCRKMNLAPSPTCNCDYKDQTSEHRLQQCPLLQTARQYHEYVWPTVVQLYTKLYGGKEELEQTATFILQSGLSG